MDVVDTFFGGQRNDALDVQIGLDGAFALTDQVGLVGLEAVQAQAVFLGKDSHGPDSQLIGRPQDADRDFAAVQGEKFTHVNQLLSWNMAPRVFVSFSKR